MLNPKETELLREIHAKPQSGVFVSTGGGAGLIAKILAVPGASRTVIEGIIPYANKAFVDFLGTEPDKFCSIQTTILAAWKAYLRACQVVPDDPQNRFGMAITASLKSDQPKKGEHRFYIAIYFTDRVLLSECFLKKDARSREEEEEFLSLFGLNMLAESLHLNQIPQKKLEDDIINTSILPSSVQLERLYRREAKKFWYQHGSGFYHEHQEKFAGLLSGSFNPMHEGHRKLRSIAEKHLQGNVAFEMPVINADKPRLHHGELILRLKQFEDSPVVITDAPLFSDKARLFPETCFIIGIDTALRLIDPRFYEDSINLMHESLCIIRDYGCHFLVAARKIEEDILTMDRLILENKFHNLFKQIHQDDFLVNISSSEIRNKQ